MLQKLRSQDQTQILLVTKMHWRFAGNTFSHVSHTFIFQQAQLSDQNFDRYFTMLSNIF